MGQNKELIRSLNKLCLMFSDDEVKQNIYDNLEILLKLDFDRYTDPEIVLVDALIELLVEWKNKKGEINLDKPFERIIINYCIDKCRQFKTPIEL